MLGKSVSDDLGHHRLPGDVKIWDCCPTKTSIPHLLVRQIAVETTVRATVQTLFEG